MLVAVIHPYKVASLWSVRFYVAGDFGTWACLKLLRV